jgi:hypothetical protein
MPSAHRSTRASTSSTAQASALAIQRAPAHAASLDRSAYLFDEDEDYDSDMCADLPMPERVSMKVSAAPKNCICVPCSLSADCVV